MDLLNSGGHHNESRDEGNELPCCPLHNESCESTVKIFRHTTNAPDYEPIRILTIPAALKVWRNKYIPHAAHTMEDFVHGAQVPSRIDYIIGVSINLLLC